MTRKISLTVNGMHTSHEVEPRLLLVHYLRDVLGFTGTHIGCDTSQCGACTVMLNGMAVKSCTILAVQADGVEVLTIEGMGTEDQLHPIQEGFWEEHGLAAADSRDRRDRRRVSHGAIRLVPGHDLD